MPEQEQQPYVYQPWPAWRYGPNGQSAIFNSEEEVPEGWTNSPDSAPEEPVLGSEKPREITDEQRQEKVDALVDNNTADNLVDMLEAMQELDDSIEYSSKWPKSKLAETIVDNGGPLEKAD